jgi:Putative Ig domain
MKIRFALAAAAALVAVAVPSALAVPPDVAGNPSLGIVGPGGQILPIPPNVPKVGDTIESTWAVFYCDPSCDPNNPDTDPTVGNREVHPSGYGPPAGFFMEWERCDTSAGTGCVVIVPRSSDKSTADYVVKPADAGHFLRSAVYATNLDCGYPRSYDQHQDCAWQTRGVYSALVEIPAPPPLPTVTITTASAADGVAGTAYSLSLAASNGTAPYAYAVKSGALPPGLTLSASGQITGTPTTGGTYTFTVEATASGANAGTKTFTIHIGLALGPAALPAGTTGVAYNATLNASGATAPVAWSVSSGTLPAGLTLADGVLSGTPTQTGTFTFTVQALDKNSASGSATYSITVTHPTLAAAVGPLPTAVVGKRYRTTLKVSGGSAPYRFQLVRGTLPSGLRLGRAGAIAGKAKGIARTYRFSVLVTDQYGAEGTFQFAIKTKVAKKAKKA